MIRTPHGAVDIHPHPNGGVVLMAMRGGVLLALTLTLTEAAEASHALVDAIERCVPPINKPKEPQP